MIHIHLSSHLPLTSSPSSSTPQVTHVHGNDTAMLARGAPSSEGRQGIVVSLSPKKDLKVYSVHVRRHGREQTNDSHSPPLTSRHHTNPEDSRLGGGWQCLDMRPWGLFSSPGPSLANPLVFAPGSPPSQGKELATLEPASLANHDLAVSPDGRFISVASFTCEAKLWEVKCARETGQVTGVK
jgi:hypothetical protein